MTFQVRQFFLGFCFIVSSLDFVDTARRPAMVIEKESRCKGNFTIIFRWDTHFYILIFVYNGECHKLSWDF